MFDSLLSDEFNRRHDVREVHRRYCCHRNWRTEVVLRLPGQINPIRDARMVEQHVKQDDTRRRLMERSDGRDPKEIARRQHQPESSA